MTDYDIIVVGAGPIGSTYAYKMAREGFNVAIFDLKNRIGQPLQCAGLVSTNICQTGNLPKDFVDNKIKGASLHSPDDTIINVQKEKNVAYVLDRVMYDKYLFNRATLAGVQDFIGTRVLDVDIENTTIKTAERKYSARLIAVAVGPTSATSGKMNPSLEEDPFLGLQYTVKANNQKMDYLDLYIDGEVLPGFIWSIPTSPFTRRIGLFTEKSYKVAENVLKKYIKDDYEIIEKHNALIPRYNRDKKLTENNVILLGDTAGQVKPTTGGGLIAGFNCAELASKYSTKALNENDNTYLKEYEKEFHNLYDNEFKTQQNVQNIIKEMSTDDFNYMFSQLKKYEVDKIISEYGDMDKQTPLLKQLVKTGIIFKLVPKIGVRRLKNLWKSR